MKRDTPEPDIVERLWALIEKQRGERGDYLTRGEHDPELEYAIAEIERLRTPATPSPELVEKLKVAFAASLMNANAGAKWLDHDSMDEMVVAAWVGFEEPATSALSAIGADEPTEAMLIAGADELPINFAGDRERAHTIVARIYAAMRRTALASIGEKPRR